MIPKDIHLKIRRTRKDMDIAQEYLALKLGKNQQEISKIELGEKPVDESLLQEIAEILNVSTDYIINRELPNLNHSYSKNKNCVIGCENGHLTITNDEKMFSEIKSNVSYGLSVL